MKRIVVLSCAMVLASAIPALAQKALAEAMARSAAGTFNNCSRAKGEDNPNKANLEQETSKAKLVEAAMAVQAYCDAVYAAQTDASLAQMIAMGKTEAPRAQGLVGVVSHNMNEYGQMVILMRLKGIVPPTTERAQAPRKPGQD